MKQEEGKSEVPKKPLTKDRDQSSERIPKGGKILVADDDALLRRAIRDALEHAGYEVLECASANEARSVVSRQPIDLALLDLRLPNTDGVTLMKEFVSATEHHPVVIIMTGYSSVGNAVEAMKEGAYDYVAKPLKIEELLLSIQRAMESVSLRREVDILRSDLKSRFGVHNFIGNSNAIQKVLQMVQKIASSGARTILLRGESGVGKDLVARAIHYSSARMDKPFMTITCTTLQETLLESELFGHEKGAFTDAASQKRGLFELAHGGTAFLDEIGEISLSLQGKLLRVLEDNIIRRVGGTEDMNIDVRVIAATNRNLEAAMEAGKFREDLYYRLNIMPVHIPPLRERPEDIPLLVKHFVEACSREFKKVVRDVSKSGMEMLTRHAWPGNVRELRNVIERAVLLTSGPTLSEEDLWIEPRIRTTSSKEFQLPPEGVRIDDVEKSLVLQALERSGWNRSMAARLLGCSRFQVRYRMRKFSLKQDNGSPPGSKIKKD